MIADISKQAPARALEEVLRLFDTERSHDEGEGAGASWKVFTYQTSFMELWDTPVSQFPFKVAIIWGHDMATAGIGEVNLESHLSPLAWAVCKLKARNDLDVLILDTAPSRHRKESRLYRFIEALQPERMSWLRLVPLSELGRFLADSLPALAIKKPLAGDYDSRMDFLDILSHQVQRELTESGHEGNHHAIQNIVGPQVLLGEVGREGQSPAERALLTLFRTVGLLEEAKRDEEEAQSKAEEWPIRDWGEKPIRLLLVDDQYQHGWRTWLESAVPEDVRRRVRVQATPSAEVLVQGIHKASANIPDDCDARFRLMFGAIDLDGGIREPPPNHVQTILLLDLRLYALHRSSDEEARFYKHEILPLCTRFLDNGEKSYAWAGFGEEELKQVSRWCDAPDRKQNSSDHLLALTLLPRLIALVDMSLPVILFSSTGRREITERLKPYGNIITDFEKPRFFRRDARNAVLETKAKLSQAIRKALKLLEVRQLCQSCMAESKRRKTPQPIVQSRSSAFADLFLDESGNDQDLDESGDVHKRWFSVGGVMLVYPSPVAKARLCERMKQRVLVWGVDEDRFSPGQRFRLPLAGAYLPKHFEKTDKDGGSVAELYEKHLGQIEACFTAFGVHIAAVGIRTEKAPAGFRAVQSAGLPLSRGDVIFQSIMRDLVEGCLFGVLPTFETSLLPVNVHLAMRSTPIAASERPLLEALIGARGFTPPDAKGLVRYCSLGTDDVFPMLLEIIRGHPEHVGAFRPVRARAARLTDFDSLYDAQQKSPAEYQRMLAGERNTFPEQLHYLADWVARFARWRWADIPPTARKWFDLGFYAEEGDGVQQCLEAGRLLDRGILADALMAVHRASSKANASTSANRGLEGWLKHRAGAECSKLNGNDLKRVWESL